jgi:hypothetical protein
MRHQILMEIPEGPHIGLPLAGDLVGLRPYELQHLLHGSDLPDDPPVLRSVIVRGVTLVRITDVMLWAGALADSGFLHKPSPVDPPF